MKNDMANKGGNDLGNMIDHWITKRELVNPGVLKSALRDIRSKGYESVFFLLNTAHGYDHSDSRFVAAMKLIVGYARSVGLKSMIHLRQYFDREFYRRYPYATYKHVREVVVPPGKNRFEERIRYPSGCSFSRIARVLAIKKNDRAMSKIRVVDPGNITFEMESTITENRNGFQDRYKVVIVSGRKAPDERLLIYIEFETEAIDLAHPKMRDYITEVLELFKGMPIDGFAWDEPGHRCPGIGGFDGTGIMVSDGIGRSFRKLTGRAIEEAFPYLIQRSDSPKLPAMRIAYYRSLRDSLYESQMHFKKECQRLFGRRIEMGNHHTWAETESADLLIGNIDYPKLSDCLTSGYTDGIYFFGETSTVYVACLASSLANRSDSKNAYCNLWCFRPREWSIEYHTRLLGLFNVRWFSIGYGEGSVVCFPYHKTWPAHGRYARRLREFNACLQGARRKASIGLVHSWEALAVEKNSYCTLHRIGMLRFALQATRHNQGVYIMGIDALEKAVVNNGRICVEGYELSSLVLPWPFFLSPRAVDKVRAFIDQGGACLCYGYPLGACSQDDHGLEMLKSYLGSNFVKSAKQRFIDYEKETVRGINLFKGKDLMITLDEKENRTAVRVRERLKQDSILLPYVPLNAKPGQALLSYKGATIGVKAGRCNLYYFSFEFPMYAKAASAWLDHAAGTEWPQFADACYVQQYERGSETLLAVCAKSPNGSIRGSYSVAGEIVKLPAGRMAVIRLRSNRPAEVKSW